jgi:hypothetical protein
MFMSGSRTFNLLSMGLGLSMGASAPAIARMGLGDSANQPSRPLAGSPLTGQTWQHPLVLASLGEAVDTIWF